MDRPPISPISPISPDQPGNGNDAAGAATRAPAPAGGRRPVELHPPGSNAAAAAAPTKTKPKVREAEFEKIFSISKLGDPTYARRMKTFYEENGILCIDLEDKIDKRKAMREFVTSLFGQMPYRDEFLLNFRLDNGKEVHLNRNGDIDDIVDVLLQKRISTENLNRLKKCLPPHATFGAPCTPPSFHLHVENEIRQDPELYRAIAGVLDNESINCDFNRAIFRVPTVTEGEEFLHFDLDPRAIRPGVDSELQGKVCITECRFICVPGSNTADFLEKFKEAYGPLYPGRKLGQAKYSLDPDRDPWKLFEQQRAFIVPAGHAVFWSPKILHGHPSFGRETPISIGFYLGFHPEVSAAEREIRRELFRTGGIPKAWPSGDPVCFFPRKFQNFPKVLQSTVIDRLTPGAYQALVTTRVTKLGKEVPDMRPWGWRGIFEPFPFTVLGECITGQRQWGDETKSQAEQRGAAGDESVMEIGQARGASQNPLKRHRSIVPPEPPASSDFASSDFANAVAPELRVRELGNRELDASACRRMPDSRGGDQRRSPTALCLLKKPTDMHRAHGAQDSQRDEHGNTMEDFLTRATIESLDVVKFNDIINNNPVLYDTKERIQAFEYAPKVLYILMEDHFKQKAAQNPPPVTLEQDSQRDAYGNTMEDLMTYAVIESLDVVKFNEIITNADLHDTKERIDAFGDSPRVLYSSMQKHFAQRARAAAEAGARAGSGPARAAPRAPPPPSAETIGRARRPVLDKEAKYSASAKTESKRLLADTGGAPARPARNKIHSAGLLADTGGAPAKKKARSGYLLDPNRMAICKPSEALKTKIRTIIEDLITRDEGFICNGASRREIGIMLDDSEPLGDDEDNGVFIATAATEYDAWNSSLKHGEEFGAFLEQLWNSIEHGEAGAARGNISASEEEEPTRRGRREQTTPDSLEAGPSRRRRLVAPDSSEDDDPGGSQMLAQASGGPAANTAKKTAGSVEDTGGRFSSPVDEMPDATGEKKSRVLEEMEALFEAGSLTPDVLLAVFAQLRDAPHARTGETLGARESAQQHLIRMDMIREASTAARAKASEAWCRTPWAIHGGDNATMLDGQDEYYDGSVVQDGCAICGALKTECINPAAHFGARGESPPDSKCQLCTRNFRNNYDSAKHLALHVAQRH